MSQNRITLMTTAAELRTGGMSWEYVAQKVHRKAGTCSKWPSRYRREWNRVYMAAQRQRYEEVSNESLTYLRSLLRSKDDKTKLKSIELSLRYGPAAVAALTETNGDQAEDEAKYEKWLRYQAGEDDWRRRIDRERARDGLPPATDAEFYKEWTIKLEEIQNPKILNLHFDANGYPIPLPPGEPEYITKEELDARLDKEWGTTGTSAQPPAEWERTTPPRSGEGRNTAPGMFAISVLMLVGALAALGLAFGLALAEKRSHAERGNEAKAPIVGRDGWASRERMPAAMPPARDSRYPIASSRDILSQTSPSISSEREVPPVLTSAALCLLMSPTITGQEPKAEPKKDAFSLNGIKLRLTGPAVVGGRISGFAVHPKNRAHYYVAVACGGVWKTVNDGTSWTPIFDGEGSYSIGYIALDPKNPNVVWVGTGENNSQRSVGYGDGIYKSIDAGKTWQNVGLKNSEHIGKIVIDPRDSDTVYVAAQGPLWGPGGDRGLYKTTDGGKTWNKILNISENTGVTDIVMDPRNPDLLLAASYQRRRHVWTLINGGPESAIHRSTDGGKTWNKITNGLPSVELGRIGLAMAPSDPDIVYAVVEAADKKGGIFRSVDRGVTWEKRNPFDRGAMYYAHAVVDPKNAERLYVMNVLIQVSDDGGKTLKPLGEKWKHVDNHTIWIDPNDTDYYRVGCDGGVYDSHDRAATWHFKSNLPIAQFYDVACDESGPFYHVYGGTQDNNTLGGPARTRSAHGILNQHWFVVYGGDGFQCKVDPKDPNIVYGEAQYGVLARYDRRTGQKVGIQPQAGKGEPPLRWNWDSPLLLSPHLNTRLYFAANKLFKSDDRGNSWREISGDLTRKIDRDSLPVMGKMWGPDAVAKHQSTSLYGNCTALAESPRKAGRLYVGTDDGLIHVTGNDGDNWTRLDTFPGVPERTYVARVVASQHDADMVYAVFNNHKNADFKPYLLKSTDAGKTWTSIAGDLPERGSVWAIAEDHVNPNLLFVGTEFGLFVTLDGGKKWQRLKDGLPTIAVRDLCIQKPMNDLVVGTFGRGIYILDDYSALRSLSAEPKAPALYPTRDAVLFVPSEQYGLKGKAFLGESLYTADNPAYGATFTYYLKEALKTKKQLRQEAEKKGEIKYPTKDELRAEAEEEEPNILVKIADAEGRPIRTISAPVTAGFHRIAWGLRDPSVFLKARGNEEYGGLFGPEDRGPYVFPGKYLATLSKRVEGKEERLAGPVEFNVVADKQDPVSDADRKELRDFQKQVAKLQRAVHATADAAGEMTDKLTKAKQALDQVQVPTNNLQNEIRRLIAENREILKQLRGDSVLRARNEGTPPSIEERIDEVVDQQRQAIAAPTKTQRDNYRIASEELTDELAKLRKLIETDFRKVEQELEKIGAPYTPGRLPEWKGK